MIRFIPNDPLSNAGEPARRVAALPDRPDGRAGFSVVGDAPEKVHRLGTPGFLQWQARQAALMALNAWEQVSGEPVAFWAPKTRSPLPLIPDLKEEVNAFYSRQSIWFGHATRDDKVIRFGASTDVVAHEVGHGVLDGLRPDIFDSKYIEVSAFHEGFGDVTALITALSDNQTRKKLLEITPDLSAPNFVEAVCEELSASIRHVAGATNNGSQPRRALNVFRWQLPHTMPKYGGPEVVIDEFHSIARIISGCFYDLVAMIFRTGPSTPAALWAATRVAGRLFYRAARSAPEAPRFFRAVGRAMVLEDEALHGGAHSALIAQAFDQHGLALGAHSLLAPELTLTGDSPVINVEAGEARLLPATMLSLRRVVGTPSRGTVAVRPVELGATVVANVAMRVDVPLDSVDRRLRGCVAPTNNVALVGESGGFAALLFAPRAQAAPAEVIDFVESIITNEQLDFNTPPRGAVAEVGASTATHGIRRRRGKKELYRIQFSCGLQPLS